MPIPTTASARINEKLPKGEEFATEAPVTEPEPIMAMKTKKANRPKTMCLISIISILRLGLIKHLALPLTKPLNETPP